jgi:hypothetical protein
MPRPTNGYVNAAGQPIPGTHDPISRFMDRSALMHWAHKRGMQGLPLYARDALDIGSAVHAMADLDLKGRPDKEIERVAQEAGLCRDDYDKAIRAFLQFRKWRIACHVEPIMLEASLVSEVHQYGGTPDCIALIEGTVALIEFKTSLKPFPDHLVAMAAHAALWNENNPDRPIEAFHWIGLPKDGRHHAYADLSLQWEMFALWLNAYRLEKGCTIAKTARTKPTNPVRAAAKALVEDFGVPPKKPRRARKPATSAVADFLAKAAAAPKPAPVIDRPTVEVAPLISCRAQTMTEILRSYGHIKEGVPC